MENAFNTHLQSHFSVEGKRVLLAISGGLDSVVLGFLLRKQACEVIWAHCNFGLRNSESDDDEIFVKNLAEQWNTPLETIRFDTKKYAKKNQLNTQLAARKLRYDWFEKLAGKKQCDYIATAHHADDNLETFLINLSRGTGIKGLSGIPQKAGKIVRPLLPFSREMIHQYALKNHLQWREDSSNATDTYLRNSIRHHITPLLKELHPTFLNNFQTTLQHLQQTSNFVGDSILKIRKELFNHQSTDEIHIALDKLNTQPQLDFLLFELFSPYGFVNQTDLKNLLHAETGKQLFSNTHRLIKNRKTLILSTLEEKSIAIFHIDKQISEIKHPIALRFEMVEQRENTSENIAFIDADKLQYPLILRKWQEGDYFYPLGMKNRKKVSKFFKDEKYSLIAKENQWLLTSNENIVWIVGKRLNHRYRITDKTKSILKVSLTGK